MLRSTLALPLIALPIALLMGACASSPEPTGPAARMFEAMDMDNDGVVTEREAEVLAERRFARADLDRDGFLDTAELLSAERDQQMRSRGGRGGRGQRGPRDLKSSDRDGDGLLSRAEFTDRSLRAFDRLDSDADGRVTKSDLAKMQEAARERRGR